MKLESIVFLFFVVLLVFAETEVDRDEPPCLRALSIPLAHRDLRRFENDSLLHGGLLYPPHLYWRDKNSTYYGCACELRYCVRKCCENGQVLSDGNAPKCIPEEGSVPDLALGRHQLAEEIRNISNVGDRFVLIKNSICPNDTKYKLMPEIYSEDNFLLQANGTLELVTGTRYEQSQYCMDFHEDLVTVTVLVCLEAQVDLNAAQAIIYPIGIVISIPFLLATLFVYAIIPELRNLYGMTLMCYVACLVAAYCFLTGGRFVDFGGTPCVVIAFVIHFSFLASFFWLNVMCFDIWWTFGGFRSLQGSVRQRERKKFIIYSAYAWGNATLFTGIALIMDLVPSVPRSFFRPEFGVDSCWFKSDAGRAIYFYGPMGVTVVCNICLFISTALKLMQHKKDTAHHLKGIDSRRHDDNKQWFNLYLKLFIVMGISWSMEIISWIFQETPEYVWYITDLANTLQGVIIFVIFVWKDKTKRLLLKRMGCQDRFQSGNSTRSAYHSSASRTCTTTAVVAPLQEKGYINSDRTKTTTDESDCV